MFRLILTDTAGDRLEPTTFTTEAEADATAQAKLASGAADSVILLRPVAEFTQELRVVRRPLLTFFPEGAE